MFGVQVAHFVKQAILFWSCFCSYVEYSLLMLMNMKEMTNLMQPCSQHPTCSICTCLTMHQYLMSIIPMVRKRSRCRFLSFSHFLSEMRVCAYACFMCLEGVGDVANNHETPPASPALPRNLLNTPSPTHHMAAAPPTSYYNSLWYVGFHCIALFTCIHTYHTHTEYTTSS